jgi:signal transduction histidine kinase
MMRAILERGMFYWLRAPRSYTDVRHDEWALARARLLLSACCLCAMTLVARTGAPALNWKLPLAYLVYSVLILLALRIYPVWNPKYHIVAHFADIFWAAHLTILTGWPVIFFALAIFVMASSGARWGFWEALLTAASLWLAVLVMHFVYETGLLRHLSLNVIVNYEFLPNLLISFALVVTFGLLAEAKAIRSESNAIARTLQTIHLETGFERALQKLCSEALSLFGAVQMIVAINDRDSGRSFIYRATSSQAPLESDEIFPPRHEQYFFPAPATIWSLGITRWPGRTRSSCLKLEAGKVRRDKSDFRLPDAFASAHPFRVLLSVSAPIGDKRFGRAFFVDPIPHFGGAAGLRFLDIFMRQIAPILDDLFLVSQVRREAETTAASRMARELHDGVIQSLAGINLQLQQLRRQMASITPEGADSLGLIQKDIQGEIAALRELTQQMRSMEIDSSQLLGFLSSLALKFECENGITTRFIPEVDEVRLQPSVCAELARIVQEALVNVRKHSEASEVFIRFSRRDGNWVIGVLDNGRGYGFSGRYSHEELQASGKGPAVIMERAQEIHALVSIESIQGSGSCLEVTLPEG